MKTKELECECRNINVNAIIDDSLIYHSERFTDPTIYKVKHNKF